MAANLAVHLLQAAFGEQPPEVLRVRNAHRLVNKSFKKAERKQLMALLPGCKHAEQLVAFVSRLFALRTTAIHHTSSKRLDEMVHYAQRCILASHSVAAKWECAMVAAYPQLKHIFAARFQALPP